ncbi:MAG: hypothetical protein GX622_02410 [Bacteroidales bacterium]|nr:hypothetical protein [Bacteroidales bacterium]
MEQRDYLLREIEKIGAIIMAIRRKLFGGTDEPAITVENQAEALKEMLLGKAFLDLDEILAMDAAATDEYLAGHEGFNVANIELLARTLADIGMTSAPPTSFALLEKALQLYEICNLRDRTYSFEREAAISQLREALKPDSSVMPPM